jgi:hypothetical protein
LSGKYTRANGAKMQGLRGARAGEFTEQQYDMTLEQLDANLKALDLALTPEQIASLNNMSRPVLNFPADFLAHSLSYADAGATVDGVASQLTFLVPKDDGPGW